jgi:hypothetical protein
VCIIINPVEKNLSIKQLKKVIMSNIRLHGKLTSSDYYIDKRRDHVRVKIIRPLNKKVTKYIKEI